MRTLLSVTFLVFLVPVLGGQLEVTPVQKVISLLQGMLEKSKKSKHEEEEQYVTFMEFCADVLQSKEFAIDGEIQNIDHLTADIRKERATAARLNADMAKLARDISAWTGDIKAATNVRQLEKGDYEALHEDYSESIDALMRAIDTLKTESHDRKQQSSLVQVEDLKSSNLIPSSAKKYIDAFLQQGEYGLEKIGMDTMGAPVSNAYEFQSTGVIEMLQKLLDKFMDERRTIETKEINNQNAYELLMKELNLQISTAGERRDGKSVALSTQLEMKAHDKGERNDENNLKVMDTKYKKDLETTCRIKKSAFKSREKLRADEIVAVEKAISIISSDAVVGSAVKYLPTMVQKNSTALSQLRSSSKSWNRVATYLQEQAVKLNSRVLATIAENAAQFPFVKVQKMIKDLLKRLMEQEAEEADHKGWCDTELSANSQTRKDKTAYIDTLHAEIDQLQAAITKLTEDTSELTKAVAELDEAMATQTKLRTEEQAKNMQTISDARAAQTAVEQALSVLRDFYVKAGEATAFVQKKAAPEIFDSSYNGLDEESDKVMGMLEVVETDFARLESATKSAEAASKKEHDEFMADSKADKAAKSADINRLEAEKQDTSGVLTSKNIDLHRSQKELDAAMVYFEKLKPSCVDAGVDYDDRVMRRKEEIECLREALGKLSGDIP